MISEARDVLCPQCLAAPDTCCRGVDTQPMQGYHRARWRAFELRRDATTAAQTLMHARPLLKERT